MRPALDQERMVVLAVCAPWLVALPLAAVQRIASDEDAVPLRAAPAGMPGPGTIEVAGRLHARWDLGALLGLGCAGGRALVFTAIGAVPIALLVGRCLSVSRLPGALSPLSWGSARGLRCFPAPALAAAHGLAPIGLHIDPAKLLTPQELAAAARASAGGRALPGAAAMAGSTT